MGDNPATAGGGGQGVQRCKQCGGSIEAGGSLTGLCSGCRLDTWLPWWYEIEEAYKYDVAAGHRNATQRPMTGCGVLDVRGTVKVSDVACGFTNGQLLTRATREAKDASGLGDEIITHAGLKKIFRKGRR